MITNLRTEKENECTNFDLFDALIIKHKYRCTNTDATTTNTDALIQYDALTFNSDTVNIHTYALRCHIIQY